MKKLIFAPLLALLVFLSPRASAFDRTCEIDEPCDCKTIRISGKTEWSGHIILDKEVIIYPSGSLTIAGGSVIEFAISRLFHDEDVPWINVAGELKIVGAPDNPVVFRNLGKEKPGENQDTISVRKARPLSIKNAIFQGGGWALHIHETPAFIENSLFEENYGGIRCKTDNLQVFDSSFRGNKIGIRCLNSAGLTVKRSEFEGNLTGIFFRSGIASPVIEGNNFDDEEYDLKVGEGQTENLSAPGNWFAIGKENVSGKIFDAEDSAGIGKITYEPVSETRFERK